MDEQNEVDRVVRGPGVEQAGSLLVAMGFVNSGMAWMFGNVHLAGLIYSACTLVLGFAVLFFRGRVSAVLSSKRARLAGVFFCGWCFIEGLLLSRGASVVEHLVFAGLLLGYAGYNWSQHLRLLADAPLDTSPS